jgi:hypothetical protein
MRAARFAPSSFGCELTLLSLRTSGFYTLLVYTRLGMSNKKYSL